MGDGSNIEIAFRGVLEADAKLLLKFKRIIDECSTRQLIRSKALKLAIIPILLKDIGCLHAQKHSFKYGALTQLICKVIAQILLLVTCITV